MELCFKIVSLYLRKSTGKKPYLMVKLKFFTLKLGTS